MKIRRLLALVGAFAALGLITAAGTLAAAPAASLAGAPAVSVRVEGLNRTLLAATTVRPGTGSITRGGTPPGACPVASGAGALDAATHHNWKGTYSSGLGIEVTSILGETHTFTSPYYWSLLVDNRYASTGVCGLKLHPGEQILLAAVPQKGATKDPIVISAPSRAAVGHPFRVQVFIQGAKGRTPLAGAVVAVGAKHGPTNRQGYISLAPSRAGRFTIVVSHRGDIRDEASVTVTG